LLGVGTEREPRDQTLVVASRLGQIAGHQRIFGHVVHFVDRQHLGIVRLFGPAMAADSENNEQQKQEFDERETRMEKIRMNGGRLGTTKRAIIAQTQVHPET